MSFVTPLLFATVQPKLYRGSYPHSQNFQFLRSLNLKCIISVQPEPITEETDPDLFQFATKNNIELIHFPIITKKKDKKNKKKISSVGLSTNETSQQPLKVKRKEAQVPLDYKTIRGILLLLCNIKKYPIYLHCTNGELISSLVVACLRKFTYWSNVSILNEFLNYNSSINIYERTFIENFDTNPNLIEGWENFDLNDKVDWLNIQFLKRDV